MSQTRETFLDRIRQAVADGNRAGAVPPLPARGNVGYQGGGDDLVKHFCDELSAAGGLPHIVQDSATAAQCILELIQDKSLQRILLGRGPVIDQLHLTERLRERGLVVHVTDTLDPGTARDDFFHADLGISGVAYAIAETGSLVMASSANDPRSLSLLPPVHVAVVGRHQLLPDLFDLFGDLEPEKAKLLSCLSIITGPSKTGDIELKLVTGVHGPGELHVVLLAN